tara:strand:+ start:14623 stop:15507 length:885 start_codon:yes stop_codon:yes gene_type:complete
VLYNLSLAGVLFLTLSGVGFAQAPLVPGESEEEEEMEEPTLIFSGMNWKGASIGGLGYFTEGKNEGDFTPVFFPNGGRSRKYAYYGELPVIFYKQVEVEEDEDPAKPPGAPKPPGPPKPDDPKKPEKKKEKKIEYHFVAATSRIDRSWKEVFLLFQENPADPKRPYRVSHINFSVDFFPAGHFWFFSQSQETLAMQFGALKKASLPPRGQAMLLAKLDEYGDLPIRIFHKNRKVYSTIWNIIPRTRTLVFLIPAPNGVSVRRIVDVVQEEKALGLRPPKEDKGKGEDPLREDGN